MTREPAAADVAADTPSGGVRSLRRRAVAALGSRSAGAPRSVRSIGIRGVHRPGHAANCLLAPGRTMTAALSVVTLTVGGVAGCAAVTHAGRPASGAHTHAAAGASLRWQRDAVEIARSPGTTALAVAGGVDEGWFLNDPGARPQAARPSAGVLGLMASRATSPVDVAAASSLASSGIPSTALAAYRLAARREAKRLPACGITWPLLAGIGRVESNHGRFAGAVLHTDGVSTPRIIGIPLDGAGTARIMDTDGGRLDGDTVFDRAVGPMQFIPSTWAGFGVDANRDGRKDPFNIYDAAAAAADYLCAAGRNLRTYAGQVQAVRSYNNSDSYIAMVLQLERVYAAGVGNIRVPVVPTSPDPHRVHPKHPVKLPPVDPGSPRGVPEPPKGGSSTAASSSGSSTSASSSEHPSPSGGSTSVTSSSDVPSADTSTSTSADPGPTDTGPSTDPGSTTPAQESTSPTDVPPTDVPPTDAPPSDGAPTS